MRTKEEAIYRLVKVYGKSESELIRLKEEDVKIMLLELEKARVDKLSKILTNSTKKSKASSDESPTQKNLNEVWKQLKRVSNDDMKLYDEFEKLLKYFSPTDIEGMFDRYSSDEEINVRLYRRYRVRLRQFQEELVYEIDRLCQNLPEEEHYNFVEHIAKDRENLSHLKKTYETLMDAQKLETIKRMTNVKEHILKNFFPDDFEAEYRDFFEHKKLKKELVEEIIKNSETYNHDSLIKKDVDELKQIVEYLRREKQRMKKEKELIAKYAKLFLDALSKENNQKEIGAIIAMMVGELTQDHIKVVLARIADISVQQAELVESTYLRTVSDVKSFKKKSAKSFH